MTPLLIPAPAKLNLFLHVTGKRPDGYHLLDSLVAFAEFGDIIEIAPSKGLTITLTGPFAPPLREGSGDNLVMRAARLLQRHTGCKEGARITLHKHIPVGAGLGGGSADAASALVGLRQLWNVSVVDTALRELGLQLGSDVPVCLMRRTCWMGGIGEQLAPARLPAGVWAVLANPGMTLLTADVFRHFAGGFAPHCDRPQAFASFDALTDFLAAKHNALEAPATILLSAIGDTLRALRATQGCALARMSGSGATCFGLYDNETLAAQAAQQLQSERPKWWCVATRVWAGGAHGQAQ